MHPTVPQRLATGLTRDDRATLSVDGAVAVKASAWLPKNPPRRMAAAANVESKVVRMGVLMMWEAIWVVRRTHVQHILVCKELKMSAAIGLRMTSLLCAA
jgi:hypothetical protein